MKIKEISIRGFRGIDDVKFALSANLNVFVGVNGSGKTTVLDAIVISLSWLVNRIERENSSGRPITESNIKNGSSFADIFIIAIENEIAFNWRLLRMVKGEINNEKSDLTRLSELASYLQEISRKDSTLPVIVYYPINRVVNLITTGFPKRNRLNILDVYDNALDGKTNYQSFFEWFRLQDDIVNEQSQSRTKWMLSHKTWIKNRTKKLLSYLEQMTKDEDPGFVEYKKGKFFPFEKDDFIYEEPRYLFRELIELIRYTQFKKDKNYQFEKAFHDLEYMLHRMGDLSGLSKGDLIEFSDFLSSIVKRVSEQIAKLQDRQDYNEDKKEIVTFIWEALLFAVLLSLWWLSDKGKKEIENIFFQYSPVKYKDQKWRKDSFKFIHELNEVIFNDKKRLEKATNNEGRELTFVTKTIENFIPGYANLRIRRTPRPHMLVDKDDVEISLDQLSDGEKNLIALVGDIARRLSIANPNSKSPLEGEGIILIDEIDLHLHPSWQRLMIPQLGKAFPNCQFIITTHSPQVLSHIPHDNIFLLKNDKNGFTYSKATESFGQSSDRILEDLLEVDARPSEQKKMLHDLFLSIQKGDLNSAKSKLKTLLDLIGEDPELVKANVLIKRKEIIGK